MIIAASTRVRSSVCCVTTLSLTRVHRYAVEHFELCRWFLNHGADPNAGCVLDKTPLSAAVQHGPLEVVDLLFLNGGSVKHGQLLHYAVWRERNDRQMVVEYLVRKGAAINALMYENKLHCFEQRKAFGLGTPLHDAAALGYEDVVQLLLDKGADVSFSMQDSLGLLPFQRAEANGHRAMAEFLRRQTVPLAV